MKVLIIGAGAAGITASHLLSERGVDFEILEASSTHGGRVRKLEEFADFPIDIGGEWIHQWIRARPAVFTALLTGADTRFPTFPDKPETVSTWKGGRLCERNWIRRLPMPTDFKFADSTWFDAIDTLATPGVLDRTRFNSVVASIDDDGTNVRAVTEDGSTHVADKVLVTVPISMLQRESIQFSPPLPADKIAEIRKEQMPGGLKVFIDFSERFYPDFLHVGGLIRNTGYSETSYYNAAFGKSSERHVLGFFGQGARAERYITNSTDEALIKYVIAELDEIFSGKASEHYVKHVVQDWTCEPHIMGSYSQRKANAKKLAEPVGDCVYFAGEAMNPNGKTIAVHGAVESAYSAVDAMLGTISN